MTPPEEIYDDEEHYFIDDNIEVYLQNKRFVVHNLKEFDKILRWFSW